MPLRPAYCTAALNPRSVLSIAAVHSRYYRHAWLAEPRVYVTDDLHEGVRIHENFRTALGELNQSLNLSMYQ